jgi:hypothetical protein
MMVWNDLLARCNSVNIEEYDNTSISGKFYSLEGNDKKAYQLSVKAHWKAKTEEGSLFKRSALSIYIQSWNYVVSIIKEDETIFTRS